MLKDILYLIEHVKSHTSFNDPCGFIDKWIRFVETLIFVKSGEETPSFMEHT